MSSVILPLRVAPRYTRSIHIERDFTERGIGLHDYHITPLVLQCVARVMAGVQHESNDRAFSLIGPYGSGKSAFAVFLAHYLQSTPVQRRALVQTQQVAELSPPFSVEGPVLLPVMVSGNNSALRPALLHALHKAVSDTPELAYVCDPIASLVQHALDQGALDPRTVTDVTTRVAQLVASSTRYRGIALFIDELGQHLNFAAQRGDERDLFVLQTLAEMANRSTDVPCMVLTILHQSFDRYTQTSGATQRTEWAKVQGRFTELPFLEPSSQMMRMVSRALTPDHYLLPAWQREWGERLAHTAASLGLRPADLDARAWQRIVTDAYPLHPTVLATLPLLFRQLAQNERSLFAFLSAEEPWGLQDFYQHARATTHERPVYRLPHLYNYVELTMGASLFSQARGQRWAELAEARAVLTNASDTARDVLTTIGTLGALGQSRGLRASSEQLAFGLRDHTENQEVSAAINLLVDRRAITFRQFRQSYRIWEGSDLDVDTLTQQVRNELAGRLSLVELLKQTGQRLPLLARRFSYETGAVRTFDVQYVSADDLPASYRTAQSEGEVLLIVAPDQEGLHLARAWALHADRCDEAMRIVVVPNLIETLRDLLLEVGAFGSILANEPALEHDRAARREVAGRLAEAQQALNGTLQQLYGAAQSTWYWRGSAQTLRTERQIDDLLSAACAAALHATPHIWNELIVRRQPSAAAAKARRNLIEAMLDHGHEHVLGLTGYPPERAIYESVFHESGIHRERSDGVWEFGAPPEQDPMHLRPAWDAMQQFINSSAAQPQQLTLLYATLEAPPYGVKTGLLPLLFTAAYSANAGEVALYEHGNYVPVPDIALFERLIRQPGYFAVRQTRVSGVRVAVYERLAHALAPRLLAQDGHPAILDAVTPLLRLARKLPAYSRTTSHISAQTRAIRQVLLTAPAPDVLLFEALPAACDLPPFPADQPFDDAQVEQFFQRLRSALEELQGAYDQLRARVVRHVCAAFDAETSEPAALHAELTTRYQRIAGVVSDGELRALGVRLTNATADAVWVESVAALVGRKPLDAWSDADSAAFALHLADLGRRFRLVEQIAVATQQMPPETPVIRVSLADAHEERSVVVTRIETSPETVSLRRELVEALERYSSLTRKQHVSIIAEVLHTLIGDQDEHSTEAERSKH